MADDFVAATKPWGEVPARRADVTEQIKAFILRNGLRPGDPMPTEPELCQALGASRSSVREAIKTLRALDIVDVRHGHGTYVGELSMSSLVESLTFRAMLSSRDDFAMLEEIVNVRQLLEQGLAERIVNAFTDELHESLTELVAQMRDRAERNEPFLEQDRAFHLQLTGALGNRLVTELVGAFWEGHAIVTPMLDTDAAEARATASAHAVIVDAAARGDVPAFVQAIADHYAPVRRQLAIKMRTASLDGSRPNRG